ncbi:hypothetical protein PanWU01x14_231480, partial [Parasponia andersonii]
MSIDGRTNISVVLATPKWKKFDRTGYCSAKSSKRTGTAVLGSGVCHVHGASAPSPRYCGTTAPYHDAAAPYHGATAPPIRPSWRRNTKFCIAAPGK